MRHKKQRLQLPVFKKLSLVFLIIISFISMGCDLFNNSINNEEFQIRGQIVNSNGDGVSGVTISFIGGDGVVVSDLEGTWNSSQSSFPILVLPQKEKCSFDPEYIVINKDFEESIDFLQLNNISGKVTNSVEQGLVNVEMQFSDGTESVYTGINGEWNAVGLSEDVEITPILAGYKFEQEISKVNANFSILFRSVNEVGYRGPSGGYIFYDDESDGIDNIPNKRFLEAAPFGWYNGGSDPSFAWGADGVFLGNTESILGSGYQNTLNVVQSVNDLETGGELDFASIICVQAIIAGYNDWFLPSQDELSLLYSELANKGFGQFKTTAFSYYLSSTEDSSEYIECGDFGEGGISGGYNKNQKYLVRPIRMF